MEYIDNNKIKSIFYQISKDFIFPNFRNLKSEQINFKNNKDIVTNVDIEIENYLRTVLTQLIKNSNFIGEELFSTKPEILDYYNHKQYCWTVDPIDGTNNFVKGKENFAIMIALTFSSKILQSWIYKPISQEFMYSKVNEGTYLDDKKLFNDKYSPISNCIGSISTKYWNKNLENNIKYLKNHFKQVNSYGSIGCEYFDIVLGKRNFAILSKLSPWDHIPGILLIRESGGNDLNFDGYPYNFNKKFENLIVSSSKKLNIEILKKIKELNS